MEDLSKLTDGQLRDRANRVAQEVRRSEAEHMRLNEWAEATAAMWRQAGNDRALAEHERRAGEIRAVRESHLKRQRQELADIEGEMARRRGLAQAQNNTELRADLLSRWRSAGGTDAEFEANYEELRRQELFRRTLEPKTNHQSVSHYRARL